MNISNSNNWGSRLRPFVCQLYEASERDHAACVQAEKTSCFKAAFFGFLPQIAGWVVWVKNRKESQEEGILSGRREALSPRACKARGFLWVTPFHDATFLGMKLIPSYQNSIPRKMPHFWCPKCCILFYR
jgi:hypothetical protein